jgi:glutamate racemase
MMNKNQELPIGIFDSGIGGLTVVSRIHHLLPHEDLIYLGDTARVPYGTKSPNTVIRFACEDTQFLVQQRVKAVVVACNTASAWALPALEKLFSVPVYGVILPGAISALKKTRNRRIGIIGTTATTNSLAYLKAIRAQEETAQVFSQACPLLVPLVEEGWTQHAVTTAILREYLAPLLAKEIDTLVLGCTHYPLLRDAIRDVVGKGIALVDSAETCARHVSECLGQLHLLQTHRRKGRIQPFVTDAAEQFNTMAKRFLAAPTERAWKVELSSMLPQ